MNNRHTRYLGSVPTTDQSWRKVTKSRGTPAHTASRVARDTVVVAILANKLVSPCNTYVTFILCPLFVSQLLPVSIVTGDCDNSVWGVQVSTTKLLKHVGRPLNITAHTASRATWDTVVVTILTNRLVSPCNTYYSDLVSPFIVIPGPSDATRPDTSSATLQNGQFRDT